MKLKIDKILEILFDIFGISHMKFSRSFFGRFVSFGVFVVHVSLLTFSIGYAVQILHQNHLVEMLKSYTKICIFVVVTLTAFVILVQAWQGGELESEIEENLKKVDEVLSGHWKKKNLKKKVNRLKVFLSFLSTLLFEVVPVMVCFCLSFVPFFFDKTIGLWEILLYAIFLIKITSFRYAMMVTKIHKRFVKINEELGEVVKEDEKFDLSYKRFAIVVENRSMMWKISRKVDKFINCYALLYESVNFFNRRFGASIFLIIFSTLLSVTYCGFNFFIEIETTQVEVIVIGEWNVFQSRSIFE